MFAPYASGRIPTHPRSEDLDDTRLGNFVRAPQGNFGDILREIREGDFVLLGYPDDRGVDRNGGRLGAADAPDAIRKYLYNMTPDPTRHRPDFLIWDLGNMKSWSLSLSDAHMAARKAIEEIRITGARIITLGGGHDWAYPDFADFRGRIINVDAHLDMRPLTKDVEASSHSGTPFRKLVTQRTDAPPLSILGLQKHCNAHHHLEFAQGTRANLIFLEDLPSTFEAQWDLIRDKFGLAAGSEPFGLSIDMDAFAQSIAPGVSAPQSFGLDPNIVRRLIESLAKRTRHLGIYEMNPLYDRDGETARLAARLIHNFLFSSRG